MGLTARPSKNIDLSKIDDIQDEFFGDESEETDKNKRAAEKNSGVNSAAETQAAAQKTAKETGKKVGNVKKSKETVSLTEELTGSSKKPFQTTQKSKDKGDEIKKDESKEANSENSKIADLLATAQIDRVRHTSRPFTVPRSLTIDLDRLKSKLRSRDLQYTQNELMDKMLRESLELVTAENYLDLREQAFALVKSPEQCSRRSVTLTEETVSGMAEIKADLAHAHNRRFSSDEIFMTLLAIAFLPLYQNGSL